MRAQNGVAVAEQLNSETGQVAVAPGSAALHVVAGVAFLRPQEQLVEAMLAGWSAQQVARRLAGSTVEDRVRVVRGFAEHADSPPWRWSAAMFDEWCTDLRTVRGLRASTLRSYQAAVQLFCAYLIDPAYGWTAQCLERFGTHPVQVVHEWNAAVHVQEAEGAPTRRPFTRAELQALFDYADDQVAQARAGGRKGWLPAFRDATLLKVAYGYGLRRNETRMLDVVDFGRNPHAAEFGDVGVCYVRYGKALKGSPPKRRSVLTVWSWVAEIVTEWNEEIRAQFAQATTAAMWPSERAERVALGVLNHRLAAMRDELGFDAGLDFHSLRRSYVTHLIEDGWDPLFVQQQVGHEYASTTAIYTAVSSNFRTRTLRQSLDASTAAALNAGAGQAASAPAMPSPTAPPAGPAAALIGAGREAP